MEDKKSTVDRTENNNAETETPKLDLKDQAAENAEAETAETAETAEKAERTEKAAVFGRVLVYRQERGGTAKAVGYPHDADGDSDAVTARRVGPAAERHRIYNGKTPVVCFRVYVRGVRHAVHRGVRDNNELLQIQTAQAHTQGVRAAPRL